MKDARPIEVVRQKAQQIDLHETRTACKPSVVVFTRQEWDHVMSDMARAQDVQAVRCMIDSRRGSFTCFGIPVLIVEVPNA